MEQIKKIISDKINDVINKSDLWITRKELARMAGVSEGTLYKVLKGDGSLDSINKVAETLNINILELK